MSIIGKVFDGQKWRNGPFSWRTMTLKLENKEYIWEMV